jgi:Ankyrin repeats (3 copies)
MVVAIRPLRVEELAEIFAIGFGANVSPNLVEDWRPPNAEEAVLSACSSLITIIDDRGSKIVQFSHYSVKEYLTSDRLETSNVVNICRFYIPLEPAHTTLARACLAVLLQLDGRADKEQLATFPLALYAARNWVNHAKFENVASQVQDGMEQLFNPTKPHLRTWIQIHDVDEGFVSNSIDKCPSIELYYAALCGFSGLAKHLIITHAQDVNAKLYKDWTPLHAASYFGHADVAQVLLDCEADINAQSTGKWTPLHLVSHGGHLKVMQLLLERGAALDEQSEYIRTPLYLVSSWGKLEAVRLLLAHGACVNIPGNDGMTPFQEATRRGYRDIAQLLLDHGAEVEDEERKTVSKI